jgi:signal transduction histidine kinase
VAAPNLGWHCWSCIENRSSKGDYMPPQRDPLEGLDRVAQGGEPFKDWSMELLSIKLAGMDFVCAGGLVVPQVGEKAGEGIEFLIMGSGWASGDSSGSAVVAESEAIGRACWVAPSSDIRHVVLDSLPQFICVIAPVSFLFDRPVGYFWLTTTATLAAPAEVILKSTVRLFAVVVRSEIAWNALTELASPIWLDVSTAQGTALEIGRACRRALACSAVVIWENHTSSNILRTLAVAGLGGVPQLDMHVGAGIAGTCAVDSRVVVVDNMQDLILLQRLSLPVPAHSEVIEQQGWKSGIFVPLDVGDRIAGVLGAFASRARAFAEIDLKIAQSFAQRLCAGYVHGERLRELTDMERRIALEAPAIEAGIQAMERIHDADNSIFLAQSELSSITSRFRHTRNHPIRQSAMAASGHIDRAHKVIRSLVRRAKLRDPVLTTKVLADLLSDFVGDFRVRAEGLGVNTFLRCDPNIKIRVDVEQISRVFANLIDNALYFLETDRKAGEKRIEVIATKEGSRVIVNVWDNGPGIPPYSLERVFDYFYTTRGERGMGFGLAIARGIIEAHGGTIRARSRFGYQTEFSIELPAVTI